MTTKFENITSQIDGATDTFTLGHLYLPSTVSLGYNGQLFPVGVNISEELPDNKIRLSFVPPVDTDSLLAIYDDGTNIIVEHILSASALPPRNII